MSDSIPSPTPSSLPPPSSEASFSQIPKGHIQGFEVRPVVDTNSHLPKDVASAVLQSIEARQTQEAKELLQQFKTFKNNPETFSKHIAEALGSTKYALSKKPTKAHLPLHKKLLAAVEKIEASFYQHDKERSPVFLMKGVRLLKRLIDGIDDEDTLIKELAIASMPESMNYVLQSAWEALFSQKRHILLAGITFFDRPFLTLLKSLRKCSSLTSLTFSACIHVDSGHEQFFSDKQAVLIARYAARSPSLQRFEFSHHHLTEEGLVSLLSLDRCIHLNFSRTRMQTPCAKIIAKSLSPSCKYLEELVLSYNFFDDQAAESLTDALKENQSLKSLSLWGNQVGNAGALALLQAQKQSSSPLHSIDLGDNPVSGNVMDQLQKEGSIKC